MSRRSPVWAHNGPAPLRLLVDGRPVADAWRATTSSERRTGLLGTDALDGALWIHRCSSVHTFGMRYPLDLAFVDRSGRVVAATAMRRARLGAPRVRARAVVELPAGRLGSWGITRGAVLTLAPPEG